MASRSFIVRARIRRTLGRLGTFERLVQFENRLAATGDVTIDGSGAGAGVCEIFGETELPDEALADLVRRLKPPKACELIILETIDGQYQIANTISL